MTKCFLLVLLCFIAITAQAQYTETFSTPAKGYLAGFIDDFSGVDWTLSTWDAANRDIDDAMLTGAGTSSGTTIPAGVLGGSDLDQEVCWTSPLLNATVTGDISFMASISWAGFDVNQTNPLEYINVEYQINNGAWVRHGNVVGNDGDPAYTVRYISGTGPFDGSTTTNFSAIAITAGNTFRARVCFSNNANAELVTLDNVIVTGVSLNCLQPVLNTVVSNVVCNGPNSGAINLSVTGGSPGYTYVWSNAQTTEDISGLSEGLYTVTVTDAGGCTQTTSASVISSSIVETAIISTAFCGQANGTIDLNADGGNAGYNYLWSSGQTTQDVDGLTAGTYTVTITDSSVPACSSTSTYTVSAAVAGPYHEPFSVPGRGYLINHVDNFFGINWTMSPWDNEPPAAPGFGRDLNDYFQTTVAGILEIADTDMEVCWLSPELNTSVPSTITFDMELSWTGFDPEDYISVHYSVDNGPFTAIPNLYGGGVNTVQFTTISNSGSGMVFSPGAFSADKLQIKVCFLSNSQADIAALDNVNVPFEVTTCFGPTVDAGLDQSLCLSAGYATLAASLSDGTGTWEVLAGPSASDAQFSDTHAPDALFTPEGGFGIYMLRWTGDNGDGTAFDDVVIGFEQEAFVDAGPDQTVFADNPAVQLAAMISGAATSSVWETNPPFGTFTPSENDPNAVYTPSTGEIAAGSVILVAATNDPAGVCPVARDTMVVTIDSVTAVVTMADQAYGFKLYQNFPNPFVEKTIIGFYLPEATEVMLTVNDVSGRLLYTQKGDFAEGYNTITLDRTLIDTMGVLVYKLQTGSAGAVKMMVLMK